ncbi:hypothetical protein PHET_02943 [Paragonimus heterotremus]|uniref:Claudin n=1 Tax=Paragonimus heterotremus TaxID=100268 RepID=A0A8J4WJK4_9TREM|nr:hypothetical protein PHET_02943 [Paragonimus heterotremus]
MRPIRAAWLGLAILSFTLGYLSIIIGSMAVAAPNWTSYAVGVQPYLYEMVQVNRDRGLWEECAAITWVYSGQCVPIVRSPQTCPLNENAKQIIAGWRSAPILLVFALSFLMIILIVMTVICIIDWCIPDKWSVLAVKYTLLIGGSLVWICAFLFYIGMILYYHSITMENLIGKANISIPRSSWSQELRNTTFVEHGVGPLVGWTAYTMIFTSSMLFMATGALVLPE